MHSLRRRAVVGAILWAAFSMAVGFFALLAFFRAQSQNHFDSHLESQHQLMVVALGNSSGNPELVDAFLTDPAYERTYSGSYWQVVGPDGVITASRSLFDSTLSVPEGSDAEAKFWLGNGPGGPVRGIHQKLMLEDGTDWIVMAAQSLSILQAERRATIQSLVVAFAVVGCLSVLGGFFLTSAALSPLNRLRSEVSHRWDSGETLDPSAYPEEVAPLVADINLLLERNRKVIDGARRQAADLAHALKTPTAILRNELDRQANGQGDVAEAKEALARIDAQILRSLARIRAGNSAAAGYKTDLLASAERLSRLFRRVPGSDDLDLTLAIPPNLTVAMDRQDIEEVLGNLLENAMKWRSKAIHVSAARVRDNVVIYVDDDGPGVPLERRKDALRPGGRLDTSADGTGLGLAIANDLVTAYEGTIELSSSPELGGLRVVISVPVLRRMMERHASDGAIAE